MKISRYGYKPIFHIPLFKRDLKRCADEGFNVLGGRVPNWKFLPIHWWLSEKVFFDTWDLKTLLVVEYALKDGQVVFTDAPMMSFVKDKIPATDGYWANNFTIELSKREKNIIKEVIIHNL